MPGGKGKRGELELGLGSLFKGVGSLIDLVSKMTKEGREEFTRAGEIKGLGEKARGIYGFTIKMGLGDKPEVEQFGNIRRTERGVAVEEVQEPIVDIFDEPDLVLVIAELPGVEEGDVHLEVRGDILNIIARGKDRKYSKEVLLPSAVDASTMESSCKNGILEIRIKKK